MHTLANNHLEPGQFPAFSCSEAQGKGCCKGSGRGKKLFGGGNHAPKENPASMVPSAVGEEAFSETGMVF